MTNNRIKDTPVQPKSKAMGTVRREPRKGEIPVRLKQLFNRLMKSSAEGTQKNVSYKNKEILDTGEILCFLHRRIFKMKKRYRVTVKVEYEITMDHTQTSMKKAKADVQKLIDNYLDKNNNLNLRFLFNNTKPKTIYRVEIKDEYDK